jgi:hypothetical protein
MTALELVYLAGMYWLICALVILLLSKILP